MAGMRPSGIYRRVCWLVFLSRGRRTGVETESSCRVEESDLLSESSLAPASWARFEHALCRRGLTGEAHRRSR